MFVVFVLVSYYLGVHHGTRSASREDTGPRLRRDSGVQAEPEGDYAVKVRVESYTRYTFESLRKSLLAQAAFLEGG